MRHWVCMFKKSALSHSKFKISWSYIINSRVSTIPKQMHHFLLCFRHFYYKLLPEVCSIPPASWICKLIRLQSWWQWQMHWKTRIEFPWSAETVGMKECRHSALNTGIKSFSFLCWTLRIVRQKVGTQSWMAVISSFLYANIGIIWY